MQSVFSADSATGFDRFSIVLTDTTPVSATLLFTHTNRVWTKIKVALWASTRPDILITTSSISKPPLMQPS